MHKLQNNKTMILYANTRAFQAGSYTLSLKTDANKEVLSAMTTATLLMPF